MNVDKKTADQLLFEDEKPVFGSMVVEGMLLDDIVQKDKV